MDHKVAMDGMVSSRRHWLRVAGGTALGVIGGVVATAAPAAAAGSSFFPVTYRSFDSRSDGGPISYGQSGDIDLITDQAGNPVLPTTTVAVTYNLTVTQTASTFGYLTLWPAGQPYPNTSSINWWAPNLTLANGGTISLGTSSFSGPGSVSITCLGQSTARTQFIIDVTGYYLPA